MKGEKQGFVTYSTDRENEVSKIVIRELKQAMMTTAKPRPSNRNSSMQHIATLLPQYLQVPAKWSQNFDATCSNWAQHVACIWPPFCNMLKVENRTSAHALVQHCCTNLAKWLRPATSTKVVWKVWPFSNLSQQHPTCHNTSQHGDQTHATCVAICCDRLVGAYRNEKNNSCAHVL